MHRRAKPAKILSAMQKRPARTTGPVREDMTMTTSNTMTIATLEMVLIMTTASTMTTTKRTTRPALTGARIAAITATEQMWPWQMALRTATLWRSMGRASLFENYDKGVDNKPKPYVALKGLRNPG
jgi:hypothetical protein